MYANVHIGLHTEIGRRTEQQHTEAAHACPPTCINIPGFIKLIIHHKLEDFKIATCAHTHTHVCVCVLSACCVCVHPYRPIAYV